MKLDNLTPETKATIKALAASKGVEPAEVVEHFENLTKGGAGVARCRGVFSTPIKK